MARHLLVAVGLMGWATLSGTGRAHAARGTASEASIAFVGVRVVPMDRETVLYDDEAH